MPNKYFNVPTEVAGLRFQSKKEATRYQELRLLEQAGLIDFLEVQPRYRLVVNGQGIGTYVGDFRYREVDTGKLILEDVKGGIRTSTYKLKKKLVHALYGITIVEV